MAAARQWPRFAAAVEVDVPASVAVPDYARLAGGVQLKRLRPAVGALRWRISRPG